MKISFGRYLPLNSIIHRVDPRIKLVVLICLISSLFFHTGFEGYILIGLTVITIFFCAKLPFMMLLKLMRPILFMGLVLFIINCFLTDGPNVGMIWHWHGTKISYKAIFVSLYITVRIYLMILITTILTTTTQPLDLTLALEDLMMPLKIIRFPVHIISMIISIALRSIPTLLDEAGRILKAQASRGVDLKNGHFKEKVKSLVSLIIPLLVSSFQKAEDLAYAMDSRGYDPQGKRTRFRQYHIDFKDIFFFIIGIVLLAFLISYTYHPEIFWRIPFVDDYYSQ